MEASTFVWTHPFNLPKTGRRWSRPAATGDDYLSIKEALDLFVAHGRPVTERTLQRYCDKGHLTCQKRITAEGEKWFTLKSSVRNRIAELDAFDRLHAPRPAATSRDVSAPVATSSLSTAERDLYERLLAHLEEQNAWLAQDRQALQNDKEVLARQLDAKDKQIERFFASERDTKTLFGSLQSLINGI